MVDAVRPSKPVLHKLAHEMREYAIISVYLYICFGAILLYKAAVLRGADVSFLPYGIAAIKALVLGKFILLGQAFGLGDRYSYRRTIYVIAHKSLLFMVMLLAFSIIEEIVVGLAHGRTMTTTMSEFMGGSLSQVLAASLIMLLILIPYLAFKELSEALGEGKLQQILTARRVGRRHRTETTQDHTGQISDAGPISLEGSGGSEPETSTTRQT